MSREEQILQAILDSGEYNKVPLSRLERDLIGILQQDKSLLEAPQSRVEELLHLLYDKVEEGGSGSGSSAPTFAYYTTTGSINSETNPKTIHAYNFTLGEFGACALGDADVFIDETATITKLSDCFGNKIGLNQPAPNSTVQAQLACVDEIYLPALPSLKGLRKWCLGYNDNLRKIVTAQGANVIDLRNNGDLSEYSGIFTGNSSNMEMLLKTDSTSIMSDASDYGKWYPENGIVNGVSYGTTITVDDTHPIYTKLNGKLKINCDKIMNTSKGYGFFNGTRLNKLWISKKVQTILITASGSTTSPWARFNGDIYCEMDSAPSGWSANYMNKYSSSYNFTFHWGVTEQEFDALP